MSFASSNLQNSYRPDRRVLEALTALAARVSTLKAEKIALQERATVSEAENAELRAGLESLQLGAKTLILYADD